MFRSLFCFGYFLTVVTLKCAAQLNKVPVVDSAFTIASLKILPQNFYTQHTGFFCKKEDQLQKHTGLPLFIRLGDKSYVDYLEKKPNAFKKE